MEHSSEWQHWADTRIKKHDRDLYEGNGKPSITIRLDRVERFFEQCRRLLYAVLLLLIGALFTGWVDVLVRAHTK